MKEWSNPEIIEVNISATEFGGNPSMVFDNSFYDENGALHVNFKGNDVSG